MKQILVIAVVSIAAAVALAAQGITERDKQRIMEYAALCAEEQLVDIPFTQDLLSTEFMGVSQATKCFIECFLARTGLFVDGQMQYDRIFNTLVPIFGADKVHTALTECSNIKGADKCDTAFELYKCFFQINGAHV